MKSSLLSIGEASKLKNVSIKALRYYEKIGIFPPAHIDPQSGYRYYSPSQMFDLDVILTCVELGIPLKSLLDYRNPQGTLDLRSLLTKGALIANEKIKQANQALIQIDSCLEEMKVQDALRRNKTLYSRNASSGYAITAKWSIEPFDLKAYLKTMSDLYQRARSIGTTPLYFQGLIIDSRPTAQHQEDETQPSPNERPSSLRPSGVPACSAYVGIDLYPTDQDLTHDGVISIPPSDYEGFRLEGDDLSDCFAAAFDHIAREAGYYILTEIWDEKLPQNIYTIEVLKQVIES